MLWKTLNAGTARRLRWSGADYSGVVRRNGGRLLHGQPGLPPYLLQQWRDQGSGTCPEQQQRDDERFEG